MSDSNPAFTVFSTAQDLPASRDRAYGDNPFNCELDIRGLDFPSYLGRMCSHYRYKLPASLLSFSNLLQSFQYGKLLWRNRKLRRYLLTAALTFWKKS